MFRSVPGPGGAPTPRGLRTFTSWRRWSSPPHHIDVVNELAGGRGRVSRFPLVNAPAAMDDSVTPLNVAPIGCPERLRPDIVQRQPLVDIPRGVLAEVIVRGR